MVQEWKPDPLTRLYVYSLCLLAYAAGDVSWLFVVPRTPLYIIVCFIAIIKIARDGVRASSNKIMWILLWLIFNVIIIIIHKGPLISHFFRLVYFFIITSVILLSLDEMKYLLKILTNCFIIILVVSIPAWILFLIGVPLPYKGPIVHENGFHVFYDYYLFTTSTRVNDYNRFSSVFLEPGQMATPCVFLFHLNSKENKLFQFKNVIMIIAIIMSFSLIAYGLFLFSIVVNRMGNYKYSIPVLILTLLVIVGLGQYFVSHENNAVNALIVSRLEYDEETTISGYNRTNDYFDARYDEMMHSKNRYFGIHDQSVKDWTYNTSGYKKFIVYQGIVGFTIIMVMMLVLWLDNKNRSALMYCIMVVIAFFVRDMLTTLLWMTCAVIGTYILGSDSKKVEYSNQIIT